MQAIEDLSQTLIEQAQFYLSPANLLTDDVLYKTLKQNRSWVPVKFLLKCKKIHKIFSKLNIKQRQKRKKLSKILQCSQILKVKDQRIKRKIKFRRKKQAQKLLYIELQNQTAINNLEELLKQQSKKSNIKLSLKKQNNWIFVVPESLQQTQSLYTYLVVKKDQLGILKILRSQEWLQESRRYKEIVRRLKKQEKQRRKAQRENIVDNNI